MANKPSWHDVATALKNRKPTKPKKKPSGLYEKVQNIEKLLNERKG